MNINLESWVQTAILMTGVAGTVLNSRQIIYGFHIWIACNLLVVYSSVEHNQYGMVLLYAFNIAACVYGILFWKKKASL